MFNRRYLTENILPESKVQAFSLLHDIFLNNQKMKTFKKLCYLYICYTNDGHQMALNINLLTMFINSLVLKNYFSVMLVFNIGTKLKRIDLLSVYLALRLNNWFFFCVSSLQHDSINIYSKFMICYWGPSPCLALLFKKSEYIKIFACVNNIYFPYYFFEHFLFFFVSWCRFNFLFVI